MNGATQKKKIYSHCVKLISDFGEIRCSDLQVMLLGIYDFRENRRTGVAVLLLEI